MKSKITKALLAGLFSACQLLAEDASLHPVVLPLVAASEGKVFPITDGEVDVNGQLLKRVEIGNKSAVVTMSNKTAGALKPNFTVKLFNNYGMQIGSFGQYWLIQTIDPGAVDRENSTFTITDLEPVFAHTGIKLPADWNKPVYIMVSGDVF